MAGVFDGDAKPIDLRSAREPIDLHSAREAVEELQKQKPKEKPKPSLIIDLGVKDTDDDTADIVSPPQVPAVKKSALKPPRPLVRSSVPLNIEAAVPEASAGRVRFVRSSQYPPSPIFQFEFHCRTTTKSLRIRLTMDFPFSGQTHE